MEGYTVLSSSGKSMRTLPCFCDARNPQDDLQGIPGRAGR